MQHILLDGGREGPSLPAGSKAKAQGRKLLWRIRGEGCWRGGREGRWDGSRSIEASASGPRSRHFSMDTLPRKMGPQGQGESSAMAAPAGVDGAPHIPLHRLASIRDEFELPCFSDAKAISLSIVVFGASGDLAKKKTYPALYALHSKG
jgi:hypothetical protein